MFIRVSMPAVALVLVAACNRSPAPAPEKSSQDQVVANYQAATPAPANSLDRLDTTKVNTAHDSLVVPETQALDDAQIARITSDANGAEIDQGKLAQKKAKDARVKEFAERMVKHHTRAKDKQDKLKLETAESLLATKLEHDASNTLGELSANSDASFDQEYLADQVKEHQRLLDTIDQELVPNAKNEQLKAYLSEIRPTVESHLKAARELEAKLTQPPSSSPVAPSP